MRSRWHKWWLLALLASACALNPQPDLPGNSAPGAGAATAAGSDGEIAGGGANIGVGGSVAGEPSAPAAGSRGDDNGEGGEGGALAPGEAGSAGIGGAAGDDAQLAPGPTM